MKHLTVLSFGAGQDSTYILYRILKDPSYKAKWIKGDFLVIMSDTGAEHEQTYAHIAFIRDLCSKNGVPFYFLTPDMGFHPKTWPSLTFQFRKNRTIMSKMYRKSCTDNLKIRPFFNFLDQYIHETYYPEIEEPKPPKYFIKRFAEENGKIKQILGIAKGEEKRLKQKKKDLQQTQLSLFEHTKPKRSQPVWMEKAVEKIYPMIHDGIDRHLAQQYIKGTEWPLPLPSNCIFCPYMDKIEILWLYRNHPEKMYEWIEMERDKIIKCHDKGIPKDKNLGVNGSKLLDQVLKEAIDEFGHMTDEELEAHKMSHGHCVMSHY